MLSSDRNPIINVEMKVFAWCNLSFVFCAHMQMLFYQFFHANHLLCRSKESARKLKAGNLFASKWHIFHLCFINIRQRGDKCSTFNN